MEENKKEEVKLVKLDLAAGDNLHEGFTGVDKVQVGQVSIICDLEQFPWPWADSSVDEVVVSHYVEHLSGEIFPKFFDELWRVLKVGSKATIRCPYWNTIRAISDFTHKLSISEMTFCYLNKEWRKQNKLEHYPIHCNFDFNYGYLFNPKSGILNRNLDTQGFWLAHYANVVDDIIANLTKLE